MMAARMPRRRIWPSFAVFNNRSMNATADSSRCTNFFRVRRNVFVRKIDVGFDVRQSLDHFVAEIVDALGELAGQLLVGRRQASSVGVDQVRDGFGLGQIDPSVEKRPLREFAGSARPPFSRTVSSTSLPARALRGTKSPPCPRA